MAVYYAVVSGVVSGCSQTVTISCSICIGGMYNLLHNLCWVLHTQMEMYISVVYFTVVRNE